MIRWIGFIMIVCGSTGSGLLLASAVRNEMRLCRALYTAVSAMKWEIASRHTPLNELLLTASDELPTPLSEMFRDLTVRDVSDSLSAKASALLCRSNELPYALKQILASFFRDLGMQDVEAQSQALELALRRLDELLDEITRDRAARCRIYQTLGVCAGLSLAIILI